VGTLHEDLCTFMMVSHSVLLMMRNISFENCTENQNIHLMFSNFSQKSCHVTDNTKKYNRARQATDDNTVRRMCFAWWWI